MLDESLQAVHRLVRSKRLPSSILWHAICQRAGHAFNEWEPYDAELAEYWAGFYKRGFTITRFCPACGFTETKVCEPPRPIPWATSASTSGTIIIPFDPGSCSSNYEFEEDPEPAPSDAKPSRTHPTKKRRWDTKRLRKVKKRSRARNR